MNFNKAEFKTSYGSFKQIPPSERTEIAFAGRSNVGKSSLINKIFNRKSLARVSAVPGKTATINFYELENLYFVDLPGYGYAKVSKTERDRWGRLMEQFFARDDLITLGVMIVDSRHKPTADDVTMANWFKATQCPLVIVANKVDKLKKSEIEPNLALIRETLELPESIKILPFSAEKGTGKDELMGEILSYVKKP